MFLLDMTHETKLSGEFPQVGTILTDEISYLPLIRCNCATYNWKCANVTGSNILWMLLLHVPPCLGYASKFLVTYVAVALKVITRSLTFLLVVFNVTHFYVLFQMVLSNIIFPTLIAKPFFDAVLMDCCLLSGQISRVAGNSVSVKFSMVIFHLCDCFKHFVTVITGHRFDPRLVLVLVFLLSSSRLFLLLLLTSGGIFLLLLQETLLPLSSPGGSSEVKGSMKDCLTTTVRPFGISACTIILCSLNTSLLLGRYSYRLAGKIPGGRTTL
jgi:hypothetical protein